MLCYTWYRYSGCSLHNVAPTIEILHPCHSNHDHSRRGARSEATFSNLHLRTWEELQPRTMGIAKRVSFNKCAPHFCYSSASMLCIQQGSSNYQILKYSGMTRSKEIKRLMELEPGTSRLQGRCTNHWAKYRTCAVMPVKITWTRACMCMEYVDLQKFINYCLWKDWTGSLGFFFEKYKSV